MSMRQGRAAGTVLVTGGIGLVGSHISVALLDAGFDVCVVDDLSNARESVVERVDRITGRRPQFVLCDVRDAARLPSIVRDLNPRAIVHCAGLKSVSESVASPCGTST